MVQKTDLGRRFGRCPPEEPGGDESADRQGEGKDAMLRVVRQIADFMSRQKARQGVGGLGEIQNGGDNKQQADENRQAGRDLFGLQKCEFLVRLRFW